MFILIILIISAVFSLMFLPVFAIHYWQVAENHKAHPATWASLGSLAYLAAVVVVSLIFFGIMWVLDMNQSIESWVVEESTEADFIFTIFIGFHWVICLATGIIASRFAVNNLIKKKKKKDAEDLLDDDAWINEDNSV